MINGLKTQRSSMVEKRRRPPKFLESPLQISIVDYIRWVAPQLICAHVPNEGERSKWGHIKMIKMGLTPGFHDLLLLEEPGLAYLLEVKPPDESLSEAQVIFHAECKKRNIPQAIVRSIEDVRDALKRWGISTKEGATTRSST
jgi:hypothetical protein